ncbi:MAG: hypothetical protein TREMPRED_000509 [Tremellales sp. Tagirdzhanova-0007]|nr:MAG: hypothetical protein TREMPRED_000509 [Tremellales sp. Tagirdzhanova-0007]
MILHQIEALVKAGVKDIVLAVNYRPEVMVSVLKKTEEEFGINITFSVETEPLGTAGPLALAREILAKDNSPFFVLNSDVTCTYPFESFRDFHMAHKCEGSIMVTKVSEPSAYGVVVTKPDSTVIDRFVEKPVEFVGNRINAGIYMFNPSVLDRIELQPTSIEKEVFPAIAADHQLHSYDLAGFWMDIGQPKDFLTGTCLYLSHLTSQHSVLLSDPSKNKWVHGGNVLVDPSAEVDPTAMLGPNVVVGPGVKIGPGVRLQRCVILSNAVVRDHSWIANSIIGWNSNVGRWTRVDNITVLGDDVSIKDELYVNGASVLPHKSISSSITEPRIVMYTMPAPRFPPTITPGPLRRTALSATPTGLHERDSIVTVSVIASAAPTSSSSSSAQKTSFPYAVAIPALVGGMALAGLVFAIYWWLSRKQKEEKRERRERAQRRNRKRANSAATRPTMPSSQRRSSGGKAPVVEKDIIPTVPILPKNAHDPHGKTERSYGFNGTPIPNQQGHSKSYHVQPAIEGPPHNGQSDQFHPSASNDTSAPSSSSQEEFVSKSSILPNRPSRSVARMAAADSAAASAFADPIHRYQPKKPSPLALKAAEDKRAAAEGRGQALRQLDTNAQETLAGPNDYLGPYSDGRVARQNSGEWGVALGSPNNDGSFAWQQDRSHPGGPDSKRYSNDPYLSAVEQNRAPSGQYSIDPYALYHDGQQVDYHSAAKKGNWV